MKTQTRRKRRRKYRRWLPSLLTLLIIAALVFGSVRLLTGKGRSERTQYPQALLTLYERNPDARSFVEHYPEKKGKTFPIDLHEYQECSTGPLLMQWDERWGYSTYAGELFGLSGCGPTCLSMVAIYLTGDTAMDPLWMGEFSTYGGYSYNGQGTMWSQMDEGAHELGLNAEVLPLDETRVIENLKAGNPIICIMGPGDFTGSGHFIVLTGYENGEITVNDPNSFRNSERSWSYAEIAGQVQNLWVYYR